MAYARTAEMDMSDLGAFSTEYSADKIRVWKGEDSLTLQEFYYGGFQNEDNFESLILKYEQTDYSASLGNIMVSTDRQADLNKYGFDVEYPR